MDGEVEGARSPPITSDATAAINTALRYRGLVRDSTDYQ